MLKLYPILEANLFLVKCSVSPLPEKLSFQVVDKLATLICCPLGKSTNTAVRSLEDSGKCLIKLPVFLPAITLPNTVFNRTGFSCKLTSVLIILCVHRSCWERPVKLEQYPIFFSCRAQCTILSKNNFSSLMEHKCESQYFKQKRYLHSVTNYLTEPGKPKWGQNVSPRYT